MVLGLIPPGGAGVVTGGRGREADHPRPASAELKITWSSTSTFYTSSWRSAQGHRQLFLYT
jgi:hypothetical protein